MSEAKFTPGNWMAHKGEAYTVRDAIDSRICGLSWLKGRHGTEGRRTDEEVAANARLIAQSPRMYDVLHQARKALASCYDVNEWPANHRTDQDEAIRAIDDALAKANGDA